MERFDPSEFVVKRSISTGSCDTEGDSTGVRTVNVQTAVEDALPQSEESADQVTATTQSDKVSPSFSTTTLLSTLLFYF
jgi:hypothetical protein